MKPLAIAGSLLVVLTPLVLPIETAHADTPSAYTWQLERLQLGQTGAMIPNFRPNDLILTWQDVSLFLAPFQIDKLSFACQVNGTAEQEESLFVFPLIYDANGYVRYVGNVQAMIGPGGFSEIALTEMYDVVREIKCPVVLDVADVVSDYGDIGFYVGFQVAGLLYRSTMSDNSPNLMSARDGSWPNFNFWYRDGEWGDMSTVGLPGNMAIRPVMTPLCPKIIGDIDGDSDIDANDLNLLNQGIAAGGDIFLDGRRNYDLNNDWVLDQADRDILNANFTEEGAVVSCPSLYLDDFQMNRTFPVGAHPPDDVFRVSNTSGGTIDFEVVETSPWFDITPRTGAVGAQATQSLTVTWTTEFLETGEHTAAVRVLGTAANSPQFATIHVTIGTPGDFTLDGYVDEVDLATFECCDTGASVQYIIEVFPPECSIGAGADGFSLADFDKDYDVDMDDFGEFQLWYGSTPSGLMAPAVASRATPPRMLLSLNEAAKRISEAKDLTGKRVITAIPVLIWVALGILVVGGFALWYLWDMLMASRFINGSRIPDSFEGARIRQAIDRLATMAGFPGADADFGQAHYVLSQQPWYNADTCGCEQLYVCAKPVGDKDADGNLIDEVGEEGTIGSVVPLGAVPRMAVRRDFIMTPDWTQYDRDRLAFLLFAEWQHTKYGPNEQTCQQKLVAAVNSVQPYTGIFSTMASLRFAHGTNEGAGR